MFNNNNNKLSQVNINTIILLSFSFFSFFLNSNSIIFVLEDRREKRNKSIYRSFLLKVFGINLEIKFVFYLFERIRIESNKWNQSGLVCGIEYIPVWYIIDENEFPGFMFCCRCYCWYDEHKNTTMNERTSVCTWNLNFIFFYFKFNLIIFCCC